VKEEEEEEEEEERERSQDAMTVKGREPRDLDSFLSRRRNIPTG